MMAYIDEIAATSAWAIKSNNAEAICRVAYLFHARFHGFQDGGHAPQPRLCEGVSLREDGFTISFGSKHLHYARAGRSWRWLVSDSADQRPNPFDSATDAIAMFGVPYAFLEGIRYCMECYESISKKQSRVFLEEQQVLIEEKRKEASALLATCGYLQEQNDRLHKRLSSPRSIAACRKKAVTAMQSPDAPPPPPSTTVSGAAARASFVGISGVYFLWDEDRVDYVGRSNCIGTRLSPSHHKMKPDHRVSVVEMTQSESWVAEAYYIWKYRPPLNSEVVRSNAAARRAQGCEDEPDASCQ